MTSSSTTDVPTTPAAADPAGLRGSRVAEQYRGLRAVIDAAGPRDPGGVIADATPLVILIAGVESNVAEIGIRLAATFADGGLQTLLLDADLRAPACHRLLRAGGTAPPGLTEWLRGPQDVALPAYPTDLANLTVLPAGSGETGPDPLQGDRVSALAVAARQHHARVVIVAPPLGLSADALFLAPAADGALLVVVPGRTNGPAAQRARDSLLATGARLYGAILGDSGNR